MKEKYEGDLKKEIKKLQKIRDSIKVWLAGTEVRDKTALTEARKTIELRMERFKTCEREIKTKAYSKEGLAQAGKLDPEELARIECAEWVQDYVRRIQDQIDASEVQLEQFEAKKNKKKDQEEIEELKEKIKQYKWHIGQLETITRAIDNEVLEADDVNAIKDDIDYYITSNHEPDFAYDPNMYDSLDLQSKIADLGKHIVTMTAGQGDYDSDSSEKGNENGHVTAASSSTATAASDSKKPSSQASSTSASAASKPGKKTESAPLVKQSDLLLQQQEERQKMLLKQQEEQKKKKESLKKQQEQASAKKDGQDDGVSMEGSKTGEGSNSGTSSSTQPPMSFASLVGSTLTASTSSSSSSSYQSAVDNDFPAIGSSNAAAHPKSGAPNTAGLPPPKGSSDQPSKAPAHQPWSAVINNGNQNHPISPPGVDNANEQHPVPTPNAAHNEPSSGPGIGNNAHDSTVIRQPSGEIGNANTPISKHPSMQGNIVGGPTQPSMPQLSAPSTSMTGMPLSSAPILPGRSHSLSSSSNLSIAQKYLLLEASLSSTPNASDSERPRLYIPVNPVQTPSSFPKIPAATLETSQIFERMEIDTLFFAFFNQPGTYQQFLSAKELKRRSWRFNKKYGTWFTRHEDPKIVNELFEQGSFLYHDQITGKQKILQDFKFEYDVMEDEHWI